MQAVWFLLCCFGQKKSARPYRTHQLLEDGHLIKPLVGRDVAARAPLPPQSQSGDQCHDVRVLRSEGRIRSVKMHWATVRMPSRPPLQFLQERKQPVEDHAQLMPLNHHPAPVLPVRQIDHIGAFEKVYKLHIGFEIVNGQRVFCHAPRWGPVFRLPRDCSTD